MQREAEVQHESEARRRQAEVELEARERLLSTILRTTPDGFVRLGVDGAILEVNEAFCRMTGYTRDELLHMDVCALEATESAGEMARRMEVVLREGSHAFEASYRRSDGTLYAIEASVTYIDGEVPSCVAFLRDATARHQAEEQLRKLSRAVEQSPVNIVITDISGAIEYVNPRFTQVTGYTLDEVKGRNPRILKSGETPPEEYRRLWETITSGREWRGELSNRRKSGDLFWERASISPIVDEDGRITHFLAVKEDVTAHRELQAQLRHAQKMDAIGQLAGGLAHDFNNLLTIINANNAYLMRDPGLPAACLRGVRESQAALDRASALTRQLLACSRRQAPWLRTLDLNGAVAHTSGMLKRLLKASTSLRVECCSQPLHVHADDGMLTQILLNLAVNARDAMGEVGSLVIQTSLVRRARDARTEAFACLTVADCGSGIPSDILAKIFEPFFTTKEEGKGTGLGLAVVGSIVQQHDGWVEVESEVGQGTTFRILLPCVDRAIEAVAATAEPEAYPKGDEMLLLIEDDTSVRQTVARVLRDLGYRVLEAATAADVSVLWSAHAGEIDAVLTDLVMPGEDGPAIVRKLASQDPQVRLVYLTGYNPELAGLALELGTVIRFLPKPLRPAELAQGVRSCLDG